ncbi:MAG TPA: hypothetical protein VFE78_29895 [Gemmataceae bacterium]|nr:hypothetical protein [Gemmataceae bacterium]
MTDTLTPHLGELALALDDLRRRFRRSARAEVARAVGDALREVAAALICGPEAPPAHREEYPPWDDPWQGGIGPGGEDWRVDAQTAPAVPPTVGGPEPARTYQAAVVVGLAVARWGLSRTGRVGPAVVVGVLAALAALAGAPAVEALLGAWSAASELLNRPAAGQRY